MQFQSDVLGVEISRPALVETTALGAAFLAGLGAGVWKDKDEITKHLARGAPVPPRRRPRHRRRAPRALGRRRGQGVTEPVDEPRADEPPPGKLRLSLSMIGFAAVGLVIPAIAIAIAYRSCVGATVRAQVAITGDGVAWTARWAGCAAEADGRTVTLSVESRPMRARSIPSTARASSCRRPISGSSR
jgi:hypothetical protein